MNTKPDDSGRVVQSLREMPQDIQPGRDLWVGIESRVVSKRRNWHLPASLAASVTLVAAGVWMGGYLRSNGQQAAMPASSPALVQAAFRSDPEYQRQRDDLLRTLPGKLDQLPPESRQHVEESLRSIQQAIETIETELGRDAGNVLLQELLINATQEEMRVLTAVDTANGVDGRT